MSGGLQKESIFFLIFFTLVGKIREQSCRLQENPTEIISRTEITLEDWVTLPSNVEFYSWQTIKFCEIKSSNSGNCYLASAIITIRAVHQYWQHFSNTAENNEYKLRNFKRYIKLKMFFFFGMFVFREIQHWKKTREANLIWRK